MSDSLLCFMPHTCTFCYLLNASRRHLLLLTATHSLTATHCHSLSLTVTHCHSLTHSLTATHCRSLSLTVTHCHSLPLTATHSLTATHCHSLSLTVTHSLPLTATHCNSLSVSYWMWMGSACTRSHSWATPSPRCASRLTSSRPAISNITQPNILSVSIE